MVSGAMFMAMIRDSFIVWSQKLKHESVREIN